MLLRQSFQTSTHTVELIDFAQDRFKGHGTPLSRNKTKMGGLQMDWLRSEDLKEEKVVTTPVITIRPQRLLCVLIRIDL